MQTNFERYEWESHRVDSNDVKREAFNLKEPEVQSDRDRVYEAVCNNGGTTLKELAESWGCPPNAISGRFTELREQGYIVADGKKYLPNYKGKMYPHTIWRAVL